MGWNPFKNSSDFLVVDLESLSARSKMLKEMSPIDRCDQIPRNVLIHCEITKRIYFHRSQQYWFPAYRRLEQPKTFSCLDWFVSKFSVFAQSNKILQHWQTSWNYFRIFLPQIFLEFLLFDSGIIFCWFILWHGKVPSEKKITGERDYESGEETNMLEPAKRGRNCVPSLGIACLLVTKDKPFGTLMRACETKGTPDLAQQVTQ